MSAKVSSEIDMAFTSLAAALAGGTTATHVPCAGRGGRSRHRSPALSVPSRAAKNLLSRSAAPVMGLGVGGCGGDILARLQRGSGRKRQRQTWTQGASVSVKMFSEQRRRRRGDGYWSDSLLAGLESALPQAVTQTSGLQAASISQPGRPIIQSTWYPGSRCADAATDARNQRQRRTFAGGPSHLRAMARMSASDRFDAMGAKRPGGFGSGTGALSPQIRSGILQQLCQEQQKSFCRRGSSDGRRPEQHEPAQHVRRAHEPGAPAPAQTGCWQQHQQLCPRSIIAEPGMNPILEKPRPKHFEAGRPRLVPVIEKPWRPARRSCIAPETREFTLQAMASPDQRPSVRQWPNSAAAVQPEPEQLPRKC